MRRVFAQAACIAALTTLTGCTTTAHRDLRDALKVAEPFVDDENLARWMAVARQALGENPPSGLVEMLERLEPAAVEALYDVMEESEAKALVAGVKILVRRLSELEE